MKRQTAPFIFMLLTLSLLLLGSCVAAAATPDITFSSPKHSDSITPGSRATVTWAWNGDPGPLKFEMMEVNGSVKDYIVNDVRKPQNNLAWTVRVQEYNWHARHKIVARTVAGNKFVGESAHFTIKAPEFGVTISLRGPVWSAGVVNNIRWSPSNLAGNGKVELVRKSDNQAVHVIAAAVPFQQGNLNWAPPKTLPAAFDGKDFFIRVWNSKVGTWADSYTFKLDL